MFHLQNSRVFTKKTEFVGFRSFLPRLHQDTPRYLGARYRSRPSQGWCGFQTLLIRSRFDEIPETKGGENLEIKFDASCVTDLLCFHSSSIAGFLSNRQTRLVKEILAGSIVVTWPLGHLQGIHRFSSEPSSRQILKARGI